MNISRVMHRQFRDAVEFLLGRYEFFGACLQFKFELLFAFLSLIYSARATLWFYDSSCRDIFWRLKKLISQS